MLLAETLMQPSFDVWTKPKGVSLVSQTRWQPHSLESIHKTILVSSTSVLTAYNQLKKDISGHGYDAALHFYEEVLTVYGIEGSSLEDFKELQLLVSIDTDLAARGISKKSRGFQQLNTYLQDGRKLMVILVQAVSYLTELVQKCLKKYCVNFLSSAKNLKAVIQYTEQIKRCEHGILNEMEAINLKVSEVDKFRKQFDSFVRGRDAFFKHMEDCLGPLTIILKSISDWVEADRGLADQLLEASRQKSKKRVQLLQEMESLQSKCNEVKAALEKKISALTTTEVQVTDLKRKMGELDKSEHTISSTWDSKLHELKSNYEQLDQIRTSYQHSKHAVHKDQMAFRASEVNTVIDRLETGAIFKERHLNRIKTMRKQLLEAIQKVNDLLARQMKECQALEEELATLQKELHQKQRDVKKASAQVELIDKCRTLKMSPKAVKNIFHGWPPDFQNPELNP